jgi:hypothetical protein
MTANQVHSIAGYTNNSFMMLYQQLHLKYRPWKNGLMGLQWQLMHPQNSELYSFMDLFLQVQPSRSFNVKLSGLNLMDIRQYQQQHLIPYGIQDISTMLEGRKLQLECSVIF